MVWIIEKRKNTYKPTIIIANIKPNGSFTNKDIKLELSSNENDKTNNNTKRMRLIHIIRMAISTINAKIRKNFVIN